jgi:hypothetical protein
VSHDPLRSPDGLWTRFVADEPLERSERASLTEAIRRDEVFHRRVLHDLRLDGALRAAGQADRDGEFFVAATTARAAEYFAEAGIRPPGGRGFHAPRSVRRAPRSRAWLAVGGLACAAAGAALLMASGWLRKDGSQSPRHPQAAAPREHARAGREVVRLDVIEGRAVVYGPEGGAQEATASAVRAGAWLAAVGPGSRVRVRHRDGTVFELEGDTVVGGLGSLVSEDRLFLASGRLKVSFPPGPVRSRLEVSSLHALVTALGCFRLEVSAASTRVEVQRGHVRVQSVGSDQALDLPAGQFTLVRGDGRLAAAPRPAAVLLTGRAALPAGPDSEAPRSPDEQLRVRLERLGFAARIAPATSLRREDLSRAALLVISSVSAQSLALGLVDLPVPIVVLERTMSDRLGLTRSPARPRLARTLPISDVVIREPAHPLAAGFTSNVPLWSWPKPPMPALAAAGAKIVASYPGAPADVGLLFAFERGSPLGPTGAPARRVGLLLQPELDALALSPQGWRLFDAAVSWCTDSPDRK